MRRRILKSPRARIVALALGSAALGSLATAPASFAVAGPKFPAVGSACQLDGKISGRGSTFQTNEMNSALITGYTSGDVCGKVGSASNLNSGYGGTDPAGSSMIAYNYSEAGTAVKNGSGAGLQSQDCRSDAFGGTDLPYNGAQLAALDSAPGTESGGAANCPGEVNVAPPYTLQAPFPATGEANANLMNFPIGGGAVALAVNMNGVCSVATPTGLNITSNELDLIMQGKINQWNDPALVATNPILSTDGCTGFIQRIVRFDNSGTSAITKTTLNGIDSGTLCDGQAAPAGTYGAWAGSADGASASPNNVWPTTTSATACGDGTNAAPPVYTSGSNGSQTLIALLDSTTTPTGDPARTANSCPGGATNSCGGEGGIGYAELGLWPNPLPAGVSFVHLESAAATSANGLTNNTPPASAFISPGSPGTSSNCNPGANGLPGTGSANESVGLGGVNDNWANDAGAALSPQAPGDQKENIAFAGSGYPACGLTFDMVYAGINDETGEVSPTGATTTVQGPVIGITNDALQTLYSFITYAYSPLGQSYLAKQTYDALPGSWLTAIRSGFQNNY